jgi:4-amino-4-deoxy-L-arabinose transferase-like glycosyltransferase
MTGGGRLRERLDGWAWLAVAAFVCATVANVVWTLVDQGLPASDPGRHLVHSVTYRDAWTSGDLLYPLTTFADGQLGPFTYVVGGVAMLIGGIDDDPAIIAAAVLFGGALALGCHGAGRRAFGPAAGGLAAVFALGTPMVVAQLHTFLADAPAAAMVALAVWLLLRSERLERLGPSAAAGVAIGLGVLTRSEVAVWVIGAILVILVRGAWRNWRGVLTLGVAALAVGAPWYLLNWAEISERGEGAARHQPGSVGDQLGLMPERFSGQNLGWYTWSTLNVKLFLPFFLLAVGGAIWALLRYLRNRDSRDVTPELLGGYLVGYALQTMVFTLKDPRYSLPGLVYLAVLGTGWLGALREPRRRMLAAAAVVTVAVVNVAMISLNVGGTARVELPGAPEPPSLPRHRQVVIVSDGTWVGYSDTAPEDSGAPLLDVMREARRDGAKYVFFQAGDFPPFFAPAGLTFFARVAGLNYVVDGKPENLGPKDIVLVRRPSEPGWPAPCIRQPDGQGVWVGHGQEWRIPPANFKPYCPTRG